MKLLDSLVERSLLSSKKFVAVVKFMYDVAQQMERLSKTVLNIAKDVGRHERILAELYVFNKNMAQNSQESSLDVSLPKTKPSDAEKKPN